MTAAEREYEAWFALRAFDSRVDQDGNYLSERGHDSNYGGWDE